MVYEFIGLGQASDAFAGKEGREPVLPGLMVALDFAFCLGCGRVAEGNIIKAQGFAELSGLDVGEENGVIIDVYFQRQAAVQKGSGK